MKNNFFKQKIEWGWPWCVLKCVSCLVNEHRISVLLFCGNVWLKYMRTIWSHIGGVGEERALFSAPWEGVASVRLLACEAGAALSVVILAWLLSSCFGHLGKCRFPLLSGSSSNAPNRLPRSLILLDSAGWMRGCHRRYLSISCLIGVTCI